MFTMHDHFELIRSRLNKHVCRNVRENWMMKYVIIVFLSLTTNDRMMRLANFLSILMNANGDQGFIGNACHVMKKKRTTKNISIGIYSNEK